MSQPLKDFTKSLLRCGWTLGFFGARRVAEVLDPRTGPASATAALDEVSEAAEETLGAMGDGLFSAGRQFQNGLVDAAWKLGAGTWVDPDVAVRRGWKAIDQSWSRVQEVVGREG